jgi:Universal stress protein family
MAVTGLYAFCANRTTTRVQLPRKPTESKHEYKSTPSQNASIQTGHKWPKDELASRKIMVVAHSKQEGKAALQWCLSHAMQKNDTLVLLHVVKPYKLGQAFINLIYNK